MLRRSERNILYALSALSLSLLLSGCGPIPDGFMLAREELPSTEDRLAGIYVTKEYIEPELPTLRSDLRGDIAAVYPDSERIYGTIRGVTGSRVDGGSMDTVDGDSHVSFPGLHGFGIYHLRMPEDGADYVTCDPVFSDVHYEVTDEADSVSGSLYVTADQPQRYYFHAIYQQEDGQIYLLPGQGISSDSLAEGASLSHDVSASVEQTENGETVTQSDRFSITIIAKHAPAATELLCMNQDHEILARFSAEELEALFQLEEPALAPVPGTAYLLLCQRTAAGGDRYQVSDPSCEYLKYLTEEGDGILRTSEIRLVWQEP